MRSVSLSSVSATISVYPIVVFLKILRNHRFMFRKRLFEVCVRVTGDAERRRLDVVREHVEPNANLNQTTRIKSTSHLLFRVQQDLR